LRRGIEDAPRHALERVVLVDIAVVDRTQRAQVRDHVGPQILVAHEAGQQDEMTQNGRCFFGAFAIFPESVTKPKHFLTFQIAASVRCKADRHAPRRCRDRDRKQPGRRRPRGHWWSFGSSTLVASALPVGTAIALSSPTTVADENGGKRLMERTSSSPRRCDRPSH
jgi:hypothetical protein